MDSRISSFFKKYNFSKPDINQLTKLILADMEKGLKIPCTKEPADQPMIIASNKIPHTIPVSSKAIVIDAGGTNFRSCLVEIDVKGNYKILDLRKTSMPATDQELSKEEFYDAIAANIEYLKNKADHIGFCFSYAMEITKDGDGKILFFSKEIKAKEAIGSYVGAKLLESLKKRGWTSVKKITLLNDTTAALLSGIAGGPKNVDFSSYVGFILGTGLNNAYIEYEPIEKAKDNTCSEHIVVCEGGFFKGTPQSVFDKELDAASVKPGQGLLEKMCSGAYMGTIAYKAMDYACKEELFSKSFSKKLAQINSFMPYDMDMFLKNENDESTLLGSLRSFATEQDFSTMKEILLSVIDRSAAIVTALLSASILKSGKGTEENKPICVVANGSTFWKTFGLYDAVCKYLSENLSGINKRYYQIVKIEDDITLGTCVAAFI